MSLTKVSFSMIDGAYINVGNFGVSESNTAQQNDAALALACDAIEAAGGGTLYIPPGEYEVCHQVFGSGSAAWLNTDAIVISGCTKHVVIEGYGAKFKMPNNQRWGSFDPSSGNPFYPSSFPFWDGTYAGHPGYFINIANNSGGVTIKGLELDGNCANYIVGGEFGDTGYQVRADGIISTNNASVNISDCYIHNCGRDGIGIFDDAATDSDTVRPVFIENVICDFNCRQGLSHQGGLQMTIINSVFKNTGRTANLIPGTVITFGGSPISTMAMSPAAGVAIEPPTGTVARNIKMMNCYSANNFGYGVAADTGDGSHMSFEDCVFWGVTNFSLSAGFPHTVFKHCTIYGRFQGVLAATDPREATIFDNCTISDKLWSDGNVAGKNQDDFLIDIGPKPGVQFLNCRITAQYQKLGDMRDTIIKDCVFMQIYGGLPDKTAVLNIRGATFDSNTVVDNVAVPTANGYYVELDFLQSIVGKNQIIYVGSPNYLKWFTWDASAGGFQGIYGTQQSAKISARQEIAIFKNGNNNFVNYVRVRAASAAPLSGTYIAGDRVINSSPSVGQPKGWICTVGGTPGTWVSEGNL